MNSINDFFTEKYNSKIWFWGLLLVSVIAALVSLSSLSLHPLEAHESFVIVTAQAMHDHNDWIVPWFNNEYRLNKPPMNYWLTAFIAWVANSINDIQPWHGRLVSALSAIGIVVLTVINGRKLFDSTTGLMAGLMLGTSTGFFYYAHSARPEMLYALFCGLALTAYIYARDSIQGSKLQKINGNLIWVAFALATLTKGPHLPGMFLLAFIIDCRLRGLSVKECVTLLQPVTGLLIFIAIALPWWWLLHSRVPASALSHSQLSGSLLSVHLLKALNPYYLYRPFQLMIPWIFFLPSLTYVYQKKLRKVENLPNVLLLTLLFLLPILLLSFGPQKRWYYMLPSLMPMFLLLSLGIVTFIRVNLNNKVWVRYLVYSFLILPILVIGIVNTPYVLSSERMSEKTLANLAYEEVKQGQKLIVFDVTPQIYVYYTKHNVMYVDSIEQLLSLFDKLNEASVVLILKTEDIIKLPKEMKTVTLKQIKNEDKAAISLVKIYLNKDGNNI